MTATTDVAVVAGATGALGSGIVRTLRGHGDTTAEAVLDDYRRASPLGRLTTIDEVAWAVGLLLASEAASLHGSTLSLDAGRRRGIG